MPSQAEARYVERILASPHNLTAFSTAEAIHDALILDALAGLDLVRALPGPVIDVGTGAGIPGIPLALALPDRAFTLIDSVRKKADFVAETVKLLEIENVEVACMRAEEAGREKHLRERFGVATAKAVAPLRVLVEWLVPLISPDGRVVCWKGPNAPDEIAQAGGALHALRAEVERVVPYRIPDCEERYLVVIKRVGPLHPQYPRRVGIASKAPL